MIDTKKIFNLKPEIDVLIVSSQNNRLYFSQFDSTFGYLLISRDRQVFITDKRYSEMAEVLKGRFELLVTGRFELNQLLLQALHSMHAKTIGFEDTELTVCEFEKLKKMLGEFVFLPCGKEIFQLRKVKSTEEIRSVEMAQKATDKTFAQILKILKAGMTEKELAIEIECGLLRNGGENKSFDPIVSFGENTSKPHAHPTDRKLKVGDAVLMDFGCKVEGYCSDMTRTVFFGQPSEQMRKIYDVVLQAQLNVLQNIKCGMKVSAVDEIARSVFRKYDMEANFTHALGHSLGIDIHESPSMNPKNDDILCDGMFVTVEPGLYFSGIGGVRIEDLILIKQDSVKNLTTSNKDLIIIQ